MHFKNKAHIIFQPYPKASTVKYLTINSNNFNFKICVVSLKKILHLQIVNFYILAKIFKYISVLR